MRQLEDVGAVICQAGSGLAPADRKPAPRGKAAGEVEVGGVGEGGRNASVAAGCCEVGVAGCFPARSAPVLQPGSRNSSRNANTRTIIFFISSLE